MLLKALYDYYDQRMAKTPSMYQATPIRWLINIDLDGQLVGYRLDDSLIKFQSRQGEGSRGKRGLEKVVPHIKRASGIQPKLLADTVEYVLGIPRAKSKPKRVAQCHEQFKQLVHDCAAATQEPTVQAVAKFLDRWNPEAYRDHLDPEILHDPGMVVTFAVKVPDQNIPIIPAEDESNLVKVQEFWAKYTQRDSPVGQCLITEEYYRVEQRLPFKIKGIPGGQSTGTDLVSANAKAFESYGLENSLTSPISRDAGEAFAKALNYLLQEEKSHLRISDKAVYVWWTKEKTGFNPWNLLDNPSSEQADEELHALANLPKTGQDSEMLHREGQAAEADNNRFYAVALTANNARAVVRSWVDTTVKAVKVHLKRWRDAQKIVSSQGDAPKIFTLRQLTYAAYRDPKKEKVDRVSTALFLTAINGQPLPIEVLSAVLRRVRVEKDNKHKNQYRLSQTRAALIKLFLTFKGIIAMDKTEEFSRLDPNLDFNKLCDPDFKKNYPEEEIPFYNAAYHCGRLLAQVGEIQRGALGDVKATIIDRYYGSMSTTPTKVLKSILHLSNNHLAKIRKQKPGLYFLLEKEMQGIMTKIPADTLPSLFSMQQQGVFAIGYYHQRANIRHQIALRKQAKNQS